MTRSAASTTRHTGRVRCAIYTRKSSEEGLEQEFNSLQAQREACEAFINSQRHEGWVCLRAAYDDGGFSGATMDRPALQRLLADIAAGRVDTIVVYKIDRLTRSLADFAKIVEILDQRSASFVSVTQQFNTTTSMGRLTLNVLLSFAQFEREVIGERIRDKIAASKRKGMWMGGVPPLGYRVEDRKLLVIDSEAEIVRSIFRRYAELGSVRLLKQELDARGIKSKSWTSASGRLIGGKPFSRGALYLMLQNRTYLGEIVHKGQSHPGEHAPIVDQPLWDAVHSQLADNTAERSSGTRTRQPSLLAGLLFDPDGNPMTPTHAVKKGTRYRYYVSRPLITKDQSERSARAAHSSRGDRAARHEPHAPMASRSGQHLSGDTVFRCLSATPAASASRGNRQDLARVARSTPACVGYRPDRAHRRRSRPNRHPHSPDTAWRVPRWRRGAIAERDGRRNPDPVRASTASPLRAGDQDADRQHRSVCHRETQRAADQAADQGASLPCHTRRQPRRALCGTGQARRREPVLFHTAGPPQLSCPRHHESHPRRPAATRSDRRQAARPLTSAAGLARATRPARLCLRN